MGREEEIRQYVEERKRNIPITSSEANLIIESAKWADKTMIENAREWVKNAFTGPFGEGLANNIADEFVKAMKGE
jgi:hypothetical protein